MQDATSLPRVTEDLKLRTISSIHPENYNQHTSEAQGVQLHWCAHPSGVLTEGRCRRERIKCDTDSIIMFIALVCEPGESWNS
jgi:hypothetical protein